VLLCSQPDTVRRFPLRKTKLRHCIEGPTMYGFYSVSFLCYFVKGLFAVGSIWGEAISKILPKESKISRISSYNMIKFYIEMFQFQEGLIWRLSVFWELQKTKKYRG